MLNSSISGTQTIQDYVPEDLSGLYFFYFYSAISLVGVVANMINMIVFVLMDLQDATNISLLGLSVCDFCTLVCSFLMSVCYFPVADRSSVIFNVADFGAMIFGKTYFCFKRIGNWIIAFITCERCLCIVLPLKVHDIITPGRSVIILLVISVTMTVTETSSFISSNYQFNLNIAANKTSLLSLYTSIVLGMESISTSISFVMNVLTLVWMTICTIILVLNIKKNSKWRSGSSGNLNSGKISARDRKVIKMVTLLMIIFMAAFVPECAVLFGQAVEPELSLFGKYRYLMSIFLFTTETLFILNASVNIIVYLYMSSNYRQTFTVYFCCGKQSQK